MSALTALAAQATPFTEISKALAEAPRRRNPLPDDPHAVDRMLAGVVEHLDKLTVMRNLVVVRVYIAPLVSAGGIHIPANSLTADTFRYQSKVGLVLKKGPLAFADSEKEGIYWHGEDVKPFEWVYFRAQDGWDLDFAGVELRQIVDRQICGKVDSPELIY